MPGYHDRPYEGEGDLRSLIGLAQEITGAHAPSSYHPGDFVWQLYGFDVSDDVRLWFDGDTAVACAIFGPPLTFQFAIHPAIGDARELAANVLNWVERRRALNAGEDSIPIAYKQLGNDTLSTTALETDAGRIGLLTRSGYVRRQPSGVRFERVLDDRLPDVALPDGARFRHITNDDAEARAELHRDAWSVWGPSAHSTARYRRLRKAPLYDPDLDVVLEFSGQFVSYCLCWLDIVNGVGHFEPVGTRPSATGRGFGRAVVREGMRRLREKGMRVATVGTASVNEAAQALYLSAGFEIAGREHFYVRLDADMGQAPV